MKVKDILVLMLMFGMFVLTLLSYLVTPEKVVFKFSSYPLLFQGLNVSCLFLILLHCEHFGRSLEVMNQNSESNPAFSASKPPIPTAA